MRMHSAESAGLGGSNPVRSSSEALRTVRLLRGSSRSQLSGADKGIALRITDSHN